MGASNKDEVWSKDIGLFEGCYLENKIKNNEPDCEDTLYDSLGMLVLSCPRRAQ